MRNLTKSVIVFVALCLLATTAMARSPKAQGPERGRAFQPSLAELAEAATPILFSVVGGVDSDIPEAGLVELLTGKRHYTVFAPTDEAFVSLFAAVEEIVPAICQPDLSDPSVLLAVLEYHIARGDKRSAGLVNSGSVRMINDDVAMIDVDGSDAYIHNFPTDALIEAADIRARNGIVHLIDQVLIPPDVAQSIQDCIDTP